MKNKGACLLIAAVMLLPLILLCAQPHIAYFLFLSLTNDDRAEKGEILTFVRENEEELLKAIEEQDFSALEQSDLIRDIAAHESYVAFGCGGQGIGSATSYVGFFYTPEGNMTAISWCVPFNATLRPSGDGFEWTESGGDNYYYTEHICGNFYYYEASF